MANRKARILVAGRIGDVQCEPNDLVEASAETIKKLVAEGLADDHRSAVKYCTESGATPIKISEA